MKFHDAVKQGWVWATLLTPLAYFVLTNLLGNTGESIFFLGAMLAAALGFFILLVNMKSAKNETLFQIGSFLVNVLFVAYFIRLFTQT